LHDLASGGKWRQTAAKGGIWRQKAANGGKRRLMAANFLKIFKVFLWFQMVL
jgi:hypothetical protein